MAIIDPPRTTMTLYSSAMCVLSHSCRIVLFEKEVECQIQYVEGDEGADELAQLNPYNETPTLIDRELLLYGPQIINEYLDERLPHPPLMPVDPVNRGRARLMIYRLLRDWLDVIKHHDTAGEALDDRSRQLIRDGLLAVSPVFSEQAFVLGEEYTLVDCFMAPLLWRLPTFGIDLPRQAQALNEYGQRLFERPAFVSSLSEAEHEIR